MRPPVLFCTVLLAASTLPAGLAKATEATGQREGQVLRVAAVGTDEVQAWGERIERMLAAGDLRLRQARPDTILPGRQHVRLTQLHRGVRVFGGELVRQGEGGQTVSVFGTVYEGINLDPVPSLTADQAVAVVERIAGADLGPAREPELVVLPLDGGGYALTWRLRAFGEEGLFQYFIDARDGSLVLRHDDRHSQSAVGLGTGVLEDRKKISTRSSGGGFLTDDKLRPPALLSFDLKGDLVRVIRFLNGQVVLGDPDLAQDADNDWTDGAVVDAHVYAGWTYDYFFKRFGRRGLDNNDIRIVSVVHPVRRENFFAYPPNIVGTFFLNAFYAGEGIMVYGEGLPAPLRDTERRFWNFLAGALDVVAHELTHGVTDYTSGLIYRNESGALNESFSDIMGASVEFFYQPAGGGSRQADYLIGEDVITPGGLRSMQNPAAYGDPDHYSLRFTGPQDNGGVHINSGIPNHAFYLAVEGGRNRVSGIAVQGVGAANREQIEKVFYRAFALLLPPASNFAVARLATIQSARDLYGAGSPAEAAVAQAWAAVGVQ